MPEIVRNPIAAGRFYPADADECRRWIASARQAESALEPGAGHAVAGIAPHAGWPFCVRAIAAVVDALAREPAPDVVVFLGAMHAAMSDTAIVTDADAWQTPLGRSAVHREMAGALVDRLPELFDTDDRGREHGVEHSIEVQLPVAQEIFGDVPILPILAPPHARAPGIGEAVAQQCRQAGLRAVAIGSTDLTHYGRDAYGWAPRGTGDEALEWVRNENDRRMVDLMRDMRAEDAVGEAQQHRNACGGGAIAATLAFARTQGAARGILLDYTTSHDEMPRGSPSMFVGYAGVVLATDGARQAS